MIRQSPVEDVLRAVVTTLRNHSALTNVVSSTGIYNNVEQGSALPYIAVTSPTDRRVDAVGQLGTETLVNVQVVSQWRGDREGAQILDNVIRALSPQTVLSTTGPHEIYGMAWDNNERYSETINGVQTRYHVGMFRVWTGQTA